MAGSAAKARVVYPVEKWVVNPIVMLALNLGLPPPGDALLETTGRITGRLRHTQACDGMDGDQFWLVAQRGLQADRTGIVSLRNIAIQGAQEYNLVSYLSYLINEVSNEGNGLLGKEPIYTQRTTGS